MSTTLTRPRARRRVALPGQTGWIVAAVLATTVAVTTGVVVGLDDAPSAPSSTAITEDEAMQMLKSRGWVPSGAAATGAVDADIEALKARARERAAASQPSGATGYDVPLQEGAASTASPAGPQWQRGGPQAG